MYFFPFQVPNAAHRVKRLGRCEVETFLGLCCKCTSCTGTRWSNEFLWRTCLGTVPCGMCFASRAMIRTVALRSRKSFLCFIVSNTLWNRVNQKNKSPINLEFCCARIFPLRDEEIHCALLWGFHAAGVCSGKPSPPHLALWGTLLFSQDLCHLRVWHLRRVWFRLPLAWAGWLQCNLPKRYWHLWGHNQPSGVSRDSIPSCQCSWYRSSRWWLCVSQCLKCLTLDDSELYQYREIWCRLCWCASCVQRAIRSLARYFDPGASEMSP